MRILIVSNLYPPHHIGGYELGCQSVVEELRARGHDVHVLTSDYGQTSRKRGENDSITAACREMRSDWGRERTGWVGSLFHALAREVNNHRVLRRHLKRVRPDVLYVWNPVGLSTSAIASAAKRVSIALAFVSDHWLARPSAIIDPWFATWNRPSRAALWPLKTIFKGACRLLGYSPTVPEFTRVHFASEFLRNRAAAAGVNTSEALVIHWGTSQASTIIGSERRNPKRLLFVGQLVRHKGVHTAVQAVAILRSDARYADVTLDIIGPVVEQDYFESLKALIESDSLTGAVRLLGSRPREELPAIYDQYGVFIFPSVWAEPFSIALVEAMKSGLPVVATQTGGTPEILVGEKNGLAFDAEDSQACAAQIARLLDDSCLRERLGTEAAATAGRLTLGAMVDKIEADMIG